MSNTDLPERDNMPVGDFPQEEPKLDRLTAIAQARAIRREAAALDDENEKAQAAETANIILENAEPEVPKIPLRQRTVPLPVADPAAWQDDAADPEQPESSAKAHADADEMIAQLLAESEERSKQTDALLADVLPDYETEPEASEQEPAEESLPEPEAVQETADMPEETAEPVSAAEPAEGSQPAEENAETDAAENDLPAPPVPPEHPEENGTPEEQVIRELRRFSGKAPAMTAGEAAKQYRKITAEAKPEIRKMARKTEREWSREADCLNAAEAENRFGAKYAKWNIAVCLILLFGIAAGMLILERPTVSMKENRTLAKMPEWSWDSYLSGKFTSGVAEHYNDTVPFRDDFKEMTQNIRKYMGLSTSAVMHGNTPAVQQPDQTESAETTAAVTTAATETNVTLTTAKAAETTAAPEEDTGEPEREGEISNSILIVDKRGIMLFGGWETMGQNYSRILNRFKEAMPEANMYSMVIPTVCSFYTPEEFQDLITSEKANIDYINQTLVNVTPVDAYSALEKHTDEPIYMRTDHHWSGLGAYYAAAEFSKEARVPFAPLSEYEKHTKDGYVGTLYGYSNDIILKENPETFLWYTPTAPYRTYYFTNSFTNGYEGSYFFDPDNMEPVSWYLIYMIGDDHIVHIETEMHNGRTLCVVKDSYGNAMIPFLTSSFEHIYVIDMRYFELNAVKFMREQGVTDVLFTMNTFSANGPNAQDIEKILDQ